MANIPENTTDPILRPVTRLETTTKVFGGAYIPDDEQQRGISNLQAIELAERDQYILSRVGEAEVEPSGDIPGDVGIASLDTSGKLPKAENTTGVVFTDDTQTLENKSIDKNANTVTCSPYEISTSQTLTPTKELNVVITDSVTLTLGNGPYAGYSLPITAQADSSVVFTGPGGSTTNNLLANQKITYTWRGSFWDSDAALAPVYIHATTTVSPSADINYVVDTASAVLTISDGVYSGQEVSVTAEAACSVTYKGINGTTTAPLAAYNRNELVWNGSYWLSTIGAVIEGRTASGSNFAYGGGIDVAVVPDSTETITEDGATLDPAAVSKFILNIDTSGAACSIDDGVTVGQIITLVNANENTVTVSYTGFDGNVETEEILGGNNESYIWSGTHWSSGVVTPDSVTTFGNKTILSTLNDIKMYPTEINTTQTFSPTRETSLLFSTSDITVTIDTVPYQGIRLNLTSFVDRVYILFKNSQNVWVCICMGSGQNLTLVGLSTSSDTYTLASGSTLTTRDANDVALAPAGYIPNNWKTFYGVGSYSFFYEATDAASVYDLPQNYVSVHTIWKYPNRATAEAIRWNNTGIASTLWTRHNQDNWAAFWTRYDGVAGGTGIEHNVNSFIETGFSINTGNAGIRYIVTNGICNVLFDGIKPSTTGSGQVVVSNMPKAKMQCTVLWANGTTIGGNYYIAKNSTVIKANLNSATVICYNSFSYPVADDYVES